MKCFAIDFLSVNTVRYDFSDKSRVFKMLPALDRILFWSQQSLHWNDSNDKSDHFKMWKILLVVY